MNFKYFNSDSTYCSVYENKMQSCNRIILTDSKFLDKVHKEVILHLEGKKLIGRLEVVQYLKRISKMKLKNPRDQCFAEKIQRSLFKIYSLVKQFEKSVSIGDITTKLETIENYSFPEDFQIPDLNNEDPKQILLRTTTVNNEESSFPLEMLTNDNFISSSQRNAYTPPSLVNSLTANIGIIRKEAPLLELENKEMEMNNSDYFISENDEANVKNCSSLSSVEAIISTDPYSSKICPETLNYEKTVDSTKYHANSEHIVLKCNDEMKNLTSAVNKQEEGDPIKEISVLCANLLVKHKSDAMTISETVNLEIENFSESKKNLSTKSVTDLGKNSNQNKIWEKIESDITNVERLSEKVHNTLSGLSEKLRIEETGTHETQHLMFGGKKIYNFSEEDDAKLDVENLMNTNKVRLEQISEEFQVYFNSTEHATEGNW